MPRKIDSTDSQETTSSYADLLVLNAYQLHEFAKVGLFVRETVGTWKAYLKVLGSMDGTNYLKTLKAEVELASGGTTVFFETITDPWLYIKIQCKDFSGGVHATLEAIASGA